MLVFIDESGDPGFKEGSSPVFVAVMVIFKTSHDARMVETSIWSSKARLKNPKEFKFSKCSDEVRDLFFDCVCQHKFTIRAIVVKKDVIRSPRLRANKDTFYEYFVKNMLKNDSGILENARVVIDGSGSAAFRQKLNTALRTHAVSGAIKNIRFKGSKSDVLVQLADMCVGAIARSYRTDRTDCDKWRKRLAEHINDVWGFK